MKRPRILVITLIIPFILACSLFRAAPGLNATLPAAAPTEPATVAAASQQAAAPSAAAQTQPQYIAYASTDGQLLVTNVTNGVQGGTTQYTTAGQNGQVMDINWSPSGEFVAFAATIQGEPHIFYIYALGASTPTDLGPGSSPSWSPDSKSLAYIRGPYPNDNIWMTSIDNPSPRQLTFESNHAWGRPVFTPDGSALIVATADHFDMGAQGNTSFTLERLALDGSGARAALPGAAAVDGARLPYDLRFSPDGTRLAFSTSAHISACASLGAYNVSQADGSGLQQLMSPSLKAALAAGKERYHVGLDYAWMRAGDALVADGIVVDCDMNSPTMGQVVGGPQMSILRLDGTEGLVIPGLFHSLSVDRTGTLIAAAHYKNIQDVAASVEVYSSQTGQLVLSLGEGNYPQLQP